VYVDVHSEAGVHLGDSRPSVSLHDGDSLAKFLPDRSIFPAGFVVRRVRVAELCNVVLTAFDAGRTTSVSVGPWDT
jgi:hypothetical protein